MKSFVVRYKVKSDRVEENENLVRNVFKELKELSPEGISYTCLKLEDGVSFMHIVMQEGEENPISTLEAFKTFSDNIAERCDEPPKSTDTEVVGSYPALKPNL